MATTGEGGPKPKSGVLVDVNQALNALAATEILNVEGAGKLFTIYGRDFDDLGTNETIIITIDGTEILNDAQNIPNGDRWLLLLKSITKPEAFWDDNTYGECDQQVPVPFAKSLVVAYLRGGAGATGLTLNILYSLDEQS